MSLIVQKISPKKCMFCSMQPCTDQFPVCHKCIGYFHSLLNEKCIKCGQTVSGCTCSATDRIRFLFYFDKFHSRKVIYNFKHIADKRDVRFLAKLLIRNCGLNPNSFDGITYVPRGKRNIRRYGYDQSKLLAKAISEIYDIPLIVALKRKNLKKDKDQKLLNISQRKLNAYEKYEVAFIPQEKYKRILLVDDIITTGSTINACADMLRKNFSKIITIAVLAKTNTFINRG